MDLFNSALQDTRLDGRAAARLWREGVSPNPGLTPAQGEKTIVTISQPIDAQKLGLTYFLEVFLAREFLEGRVPHLSSEPAIQEKIKRLIDSAVPNA